MLVFLGGAVSGALLIAALGHRSTPFRFEHVWRVHIERGDQGERHEGGADDQAP